MPFGEMLLELLSGLLVSAEIFVFTLAKQLASANTTMAPLIAAGVFYYVFNYIVAWAMERIEARLSYYD